VTPGERHAFEQAVALLRSLDGVRSVAIVVIDESGEAARKLRDVFGGVDGPDGCTRQTRGSVSVTARRGQ